MTPGVITPALIATLRRLKLGRLLATLPERLILARQQPMPPQDFLLLVLGDEVARRDSLAVTLRATAGQLDPAMTLEQWDPTATVTSDCELWQALVSLRFLAAHAPVVRLGPVGVGKTFLAHTLGWLASRQGHPVLVLTADRLLKTLTLARRDHTDAQALRKCLTVDLLIVDDVGLDALDATASGDTSEILIARHRAGALIVTSNRGPDAWVATFADPLRAQSAIDRFVHNAYDLVLDAESYRKRQKPTLDTPASPQAQEGTRPQRTRRT